MVKQLPTSRAFTLLEMLLVLSIITILIMIQFKFIPMERLDSINDENKIKNFIMNLNYIKSIAIKDNQPITLLITPNSTDIVILEQYHETRKLQLPQNGYIYYRTNLKTITFEKNGNTNKFGSIFINLNETVYRIIFHLEKGRIRYEKV
ncbi:competence type IV pilus minor pilin ComGD [Staphylococcus gallinarum]|uniref:competence type IV pilus minor pilin ComGD n=1 Tax=Staphylococcus gallinarum TaxID=1293 RepID=UPI0022B2E15B|nr:competence type IV pilus minor pilin ComGD [Staphylococcus gallinarum]MCD8916796.1 prepilin-type N-terminal cleavage/methylation domain-containing protein [Staphylococcus gallinarum]